MKTFSKISVLVPTRRRPGRLATMLESFEQTSSGAAEVVLRIDDDDDLTPPLLADLGCRVVVLAPVDRRAREHHGGADTVSHREQLLGVLGLEGGKVDEHVSAIADRVRERSFLGAIDSHVLDTRGAVSLATAGDDDVPAALLEPRDQGAAGLAAAAEQERTPRHGRRR